MCWCRASSDPDGRRRLTRARATAAGAVAAAVIAVGCTAAPARPAAPVRSLPSPGCGTATAPAPALTGVRTAMAGVHGSPFGVAAAPDGRWVFVAVPSGIEVLRAGGPLAPTAVRTIPVTGSPAGLTVTADGRYLLAAAGSGAVVISVARAEQGTAGAVLGTLSTPGGRGLDDSAIEVAVSPDGQYAFVTLEYADQAAVFNLGDALRAGFSAARYTGRIPHGQAAVGLAVSPDGRWLYATSEVSAGRTARAADTGTLSVISLRQAESDPAAAVLATVPAGCEPVRVITSADGSRVWVTARASDDLLCFSAARLRSAPARALTAVVRVGEAPVGLAAVNGGALIVVADSNRFNARGASASLDVVNVAAALSGGRAVAGHIPSGLFPREMALLGQHTLLVSNYGSGQLEAVDLASLPGG